MKYLFLSLVVLSMSAFGQEEQNKLGTYSIPGFLIKAEANIEGKSVFAVKGVDGQTINFVVDNEVLAEMHEQARINEIPVSVKFLGKKETIQQGKEFDTMVSFTLLASTQTYTGTMSNGKKPFFKLVLPSKNGYPTEKLVKFSPKIEKNVANILGKFGPENTVTVKGTRVAGGTVILANSFTIQ